MGLQGLQTLAHAASVSLVPIRLDQVQSSDHAELCFLQKGGNLLWGACYCTVPIPKAQYNPFARSYESSSIQNQLPSSNDLATLLLQGLMPLVHAFLVELEPIRQDQVGCCHDV